MMYACDEHIDYVMEDFIDQYATAPTMEMIDEKQNQVCIWCKQPATYLLSVVEETEDTDVAD